MAARPTFVFLLLLFLNPALVHARENRKNPKVQFAQYAPLPLLPVSRIQLSDHCPSWGAELSGHTKGSSAVERVEITGGGQHEATQLQRTCFTVRGRIEIP